MNAMQIADAAINLHERISASDVPYMLVKQGDSVRASRINTEFSSRIERVMPDKIIGVYDHEISQADLEADISAAMGK